MGGAQIPAILGLDLEYLMGFPNSLRSPGEGKGVLNSQYLGPEVLGEPWMKEEIQTRGFGPC